MQSFLQFSEEKKITVKTKNGGEIPATIKEEEIVKESSLDSIRSKNGPSVSQHFANEKKKREDSLHAHNERMKADDERRKKEESDRVAKKAKEHDDKVNKKRSDELADLSHRKTVAAHRADIAKHNASASNSQHDTHRNQHDREVQKAKKEHERNMEKIKTDHDHEHRMQSSQHTHEYISQVSRQGHEFTMQHHKQDHERSMAQDQHHHDQMTQSAEHGHAERTQAADHAHDIKKTKISNKHERKMNKEETLIDIYVKCINEAEQSKSTQENKPTHFYGPQRTTAASMRTSDGGYRNQLHVGHKVDKDGNVTHNGRNVGSIYHPKHNPKPDNKPKQEPQRNILGNRVGSKSVKEEEIELSEEQLDEVGDTAKGQKLLRLVNKRAVSRLVSKRADTDPAYARKAMATHKAADERLKEETDLNESRGFTKPRDHTEIDAKEYNEILKARENSGQKNNRQSDIKTDSVTGKVAHTRITHSGGQSVHGIPGVERHYDHATGKSKYYKQNLVKKEEFELEEASRTPEERLAIAKRNYEARLRSAQYPHERMDAKADYDHFHAAMQKEIAARKQKVSEEIEEAFDKGQVTIHSPGHRLHGKTGDVFYRHDDGRVNVQVRHSNRKGDVTNLTLGKDQYKEVTKEDRDPRIISKSQYIDQDGNVQDMRADHKRGQHTLRARQAEKQNLPFTPDKKPTKPSTPGKYGSAYSTVRNLARRALEKQAKKTVKEEVELDEAVSVSHERYVRSHGKSASGKGQWAFTHKRMGDVDYTKDNEFHKATGSFSDAKKSAKMWAKKHGHSVAYVMEEIEFDEANKGYAPGWMLKADPELAKKVKEKTQGYKDLKKYAGKELPKKDVKEETELQEASDSHKVMVTVSDPTHPAVTQRKEQIMKHVIVRAGDKGEAQAKAEAFYKKKGYKVHGSEYHSKQPATSMKTEGK